MNEATTPRVYVGTYAKYNNGSIAGAWMDLGKYDDKQAFLEACAELHKDEADPEYMFQDFENFPRALYNESFLDDRLFEYAQLDDEQREIVDAYADALGQFPDDLEDAEEQLFCQLDYSHSFDDENAMADYIIDNGLIEIPENLRGYIDYQAVGRDWLQDMYVSNGYVFTNN